MNVKCQWKATAKISTVCYVSSIVKKCQGFRLKKTKNKKQAVVIAAFDRVYVLSCELALPLTRRVRYKFRSSREITKISYDYWVSFLHGQTDQSTILQVNRCNRTRE